MVTYETGPQSLVLHLSGWHAVLSFRRRLEFPWSHVTGASTAPPGFGSPMLKRAGGRIPGVITVGAFGVGANREFWAVRTPSQAVVISLVEEPWQRVVIQAGDPALAASRITAAIPV